MMKQDILHRENFINTIVDFVNALSVNKKGYCFAIDGRWGIGKSFVLNEIDKKLKEYQCEETQDNQFFVFNYNCWKYDYYDEPAVAIISAMLSELEDEESFFGKNVDTKLKAGYDFAKTQLKKVAGKFLENHIGINVVEIVDEINDSSRKAKEEKYGFDTLFSFKQTLDLARDSLKEVAQQKTVVIFVDELDRCIPEYAVKILERLHHLFDGIDNIIVVIAVDSNQLEHSIKEIYGNYTDVAKYLKKFIDMTFVLDSGKINADMVYEQYSYYFNLFSAPKERDKNYIAEIFNIIWNDVDIRTQEKILDKVYSLHTALTSSTIDISIALFEIFTVRFQDCFSDNLTWLPEINLSKYSGIKLSQEVVDYLKELEKDANTGTVAHNPLNYGRTTLYYKNTLLGRLFYFLGKLYGKQYLYDIDKKDDTLEEELELAKRFVELNKIVK